MPTSEMTLTLRKLTAADLGQPFFEALSSLTEVNLTPEVAAKIHRRRLAQGTVTFVAFAEGKLVGTVSLLVEVKFIHAGGLVGHIEDVAVHRDFQRRGIGTALVAHATEQAERLGCYKVILNCFDRLTPFYERLGYVEHDRGLRITFAK
jgi:glucosamine-phosphate N-acetyltransferase